MAGRRSRGKHVKDSKDGGGRGADPGGLYLLSFTSLPSFTSFVLFPPPLRSPAPAPPSARRRAGAHGRSARDRDVQSSGPRSPGRAAPRPCAGSTLPRSKVVARRSSSESAGRRSPSSRTPYWKSGWRSAGWVVTRILSVSILDVLARAGARGREIRRGCRELDVVPRLGPQLRAIPGTQAILGAGGDRRAGSAGEPEVQDIDEQRLLVLIGDLQAMCPLVETGRPPSPASGSRPASRLAARSSTSTLPVSALRLVLRDPGASGPGHLLQILRSSRHR